MFELYPHQPNFIPKSTVRMILPALAGSLQAFVQLTLQQLFGWQFGHLNR